MGDIVFAVMILCTNLTTLLLVWLVVSTTRSVDKRISNIWDFLNRSSDMIDEAHKKIWGHQKQLVQQAINLTERQATLFEIYGELNKSHNTLFSHYNEFLGILKLHTDKVDEELNRLNKDVGKLYEDWRMDSNGADWWKSPDNES